MLDVIILNIFFFSVLFLYLIALFWLFIIFLKEDNDGVKMKTNKKTNWIFCKTCNETKKIVAMEFTKENTLLIVPECQHECYYKLQKE